MDNYLEAATIVLASLKEPPTKHFTSEACVDGLDFCFSRGSALLTQLESVWGTCQTKPNDS
jgi:hypothetical protein